MIRLKNVVKTYADGEGRVYALDDVSLEVEKRFYGHFRSVRFGKIHTG